MQHFIYTFLLVVTALAYTSCVSDSSPDSGKVPETPPKVVKKETPKPPVEPPSVVQEQPTPTPKSVPTPKPQKVVTTPPPPKVKPTPPPPKAKPTPPPAAKQPVAKTYVPPTTTTQPIKKEYTPPPPPPPPPVKSGGKIAFDKPTLDYGYIEQGDVINHKFKYTNTGSVPVNILRADASCGCTQPTYSFLAINPGEQGEIGVRFDSKGKLGKMESKVTLLTDAKPEKHVLYLVGTITPPKKEKGKKEEADEEKEKTAKEDEKSKDAEEKEVVKDEDKTEKENTEPEVNKDNPKKKLKDRLPFRGRKLPKGTPPGERENKDSENDESGRN